MQSRKRVSRFGITVMTVAMGLLTAWCIATAAQEAKRPDVVSECNARVWEVQAKTVATDLALSTEQTTKLVDAYRAARASHATAADAVAGPAERSDPQKMREVNQAERAKFETALKGFLNEEQIGKALLTLGSFFRRWDGMVEVLDGMGLAQKDFEEAMRLTAGYIAEWNRAMEAAMASGDRESMRGKANDLKEQLDAAIAKVLSTEQMAKWMEATDKR